MTPTTDLSGRDPVEVLAEEFFVRQRCGERPTLDEYTDRYPDLADRIRDVFPALMLLEELGPKPTATPAEPERLGEFRILREVGRGGMGVVYEAVQEPLGRRVALKVLSPLTARDGAFLARFRREARTAARLHHTHIVPVYGVGEQDGVHFLAMQLIRGVGLDVALAALRDPTAGAETPPGPATTPADGSLASDGAAPAPAGDAPAVQLAHLHRTDPAAYIRTVADLLAQAADALAYAHAQGVVHRDIKPGNLLLDDQGTLWVSDFGLAKAESGDDLTQPGFVVGTPRYLAPERFDGNDTTAGDVYALGATLYELLTLRPAFDGNDRDRLMERIRSQEPVPPRTLCPGLPRDLETVCLKALAKEPAQRYAASELATDLRRYLDGRPVRARRVGPVERLARWARRNPVVAGLTAGLFVALAGGLIASLALWRLAERRGDAAAAHAATAAANAATAATHAATAEARLKDAVAAVDTFLTRVSQETLLDAPGLQPLREELLQDALQFYERFLAERRDDAALRRDVARTQVQIVRLLRVLQRLREAEPRAREAIGLYEQLVREEPNEPRHQFGLASAYDALAGTLIRRDPPAARAALTSADQYLEPLVRTDPPNRTALHLQAEILTRASKSAYREGRFADAAADFDRGRAVLARLTALAPDNLALKRSVARMEIESAKAQNAIGQGAEAHRRLERGRNILDELRASGWRSQQADFDLALALNGLATVNPVSAADVDQLVTRATELLDNLHTKNPAVPDYAVNLAFTLNRRAGLLRQANPTRAAEALPLLERGQTLLREVLAVLPDEQDAQNNLGGTLTTLALCYRTLTRHEDELAAQTAARDIYAELRRQYPGQVSFLLYLGGSWNGIGNALNDLRRPVEAQTAFESAIACQRELLAGRPDYATSRQYLANHTVGLARAVRNQGRLDEAMDILGQLRDLNPRSATHLVGVVEEVAGWVRRFQSSREPGAAAARVRCQDFALDALRRAAALGYKNAQHLETHAFFAPLRGLAEFQTLVQAVKANAAGGR